MARGPHWRANLRAYLLPRPLRGGGFLLLPIVELFAGAALLAGRPAMGAVVILALLTIFCGAILRARAKLKTDRLGCACFGTSSVHDYRVLLGRNLALAAAAAVIVAMRPLGETTGPGLPGAGPAMQAALGVLVAIVGLGWLALQRANLRAESSSASPRPDDLQGNSVGSDFSDPPSNATESYDASDPVRDARRSDM
jgi:hypothetical protein